MKLCSHCGLTIDSDDKRFCPNCGAPVESTPVHYEPEYEEQVVYEDCPYPMQWHQFFSNIGVFILAAIYVFMGFKFFDGSILGFLLNVEGLKLEKTVGMPEEFEMLVMLTKFFGVIMIWGVVDCILTRNQLLSYDYRAPKKAMGVVSYGITIPLVYFLIFFFVIVIQVEGRALDSIMRLLFSELELICPVTLYFAGFLVLSALNSTYYTRRRSVFDQ